MMRTKRAMAGLAAIMTIGTAPGAMAADPPPAFNQCKACHSVVAGKNGVGPSLFGVFGRRANTASGFKYSQAHLNWGGTWDEGNLTRYLTNPKAFIPGNRMAFAGLKKPEDVKAVIDYLKTVR